MALTRAALISAVASELAGVLTLAGFAATDTTGNMKEPADRTFRALDVTEANLSSATVATSGEEQGIAYLTYFTLAKAVMATVSKMNVKAGSASANLKEQHDNLLRMLANALAIAQSFGLNLPGNGQSGYIPVPYAGGVSVSDYDTIAADTDRVPSMFDLSDIAISGVEPVEWSEWRW